MINSTIPNEAHYRWLANLLGETSGCVDGLIVRLALYCWKDWMREALHDVLDGLELHLDVLGGPECLFALLMKTYFWYGGQRKR
jgi:hypothetical protein